MTSLPSAAALAPSPWFRRTAGAVLVYFALQALLRVTVQPWGVEKDEAEQLLWTQAFALGYGTQPPLYTWLQAAVFVLTGPGVAGLALLKNTLLAATVLLMADTARRLLPPRAAIAATAALALLPPLSWEGQRDLTHSVLLVFAAAMTLWALVRLLARRSACGYLLLGAAAAIGLLAKYSYAMLAAAWLAALLALPEGRALLRDRRFALAVLAAALLVAPHALWLLDHWGTASAGTLDKLEAPDDAGRLSQIALGLRGLARAVAGVGALWALAVLPLFLRPWRSAPSAKPPAPWPRLVAAYGVAAGVLLLVLVLAGAGQVRSRWLLPLALPLPLFALVARPGWWGRPRALAAQAILGAALALAIAAALALRPGWLASKGRFNDTHRPVQALAAAIGPLPAGARLLAAPSHLAGSLRLAYPDHAVDLLDAGDALRVLGGQPAGSVVVVDGADARSAALREALPSRLGAPRALAVPWAGAAPEAPKAPYLLWRLR